jgi:hypothetical protein
MNLQAHDVKIKLLSERCERDVSAWNTLQTELGSIGSIVDSVDSLRAEMEALCGQLEHLDIALDDHIKAKELRDLHRWKSEINRDTENFQASRARELANFEKTLKAEQSRRIRQKAEEEARAVKEAELLKRKEAKAKAEEEQRKSAAEQASTLQSKAAISQPAGADQSSNEEKMKDSQTSAAEPEKPLPADPEIKGDEKKSDENELEVNDEVLSALEEKGKDS